ncbi:hypothetical protein [Mycobacterium paragordonae]|uniref:Uncharacterized protein n=1 Tax=Mycobacterium paragordonae TaxID=1389713 RepID=A0A4R5WKI0_9MYCO|nr:hypothetical protein [Mycobacterium paragordonae]MDP7738988.1 hypothetical protein [Mycobacterium paragordonae]TDK90280.1 hypothetical protein EUA02_23885 [Mycobacterium paragordonae]TDL03097.1 hypothetical protein EUA05_25640 [Mycobacterium paragordonae]
MISGESAQPDDDEEALVARAAARMRAAGRRVVTDADPDVTRRQVRADATAAQAIWFGLAGLDVGFAAAVDHASTPCECCPDDVGLASMPSEVFRAANVRLVGDARRVLDDPALRAAAVVLPPCCARDRPKVEMLMWQIINRLRDQLTDAQRADLRLRCADGDNDFELRLLRAGYVAALGQVTGDDDMMAAATALAIREGYERAFGGLTIPAVFSVAAPAVWRTGRDIAPDTLAAILRAELVLLDTLMVYPEADVGGGG